jgi:hypothetical protein
MAKDGRYVLENKGRNAVTKQDIKKYKNEGKWEIFCEQYICMGSLLCKREVLPRCRSRPML